jgi:hypothetical protein
MIRGVSWGAVLCLLMASLPVLAQRIYTPPAGSAERKAIMDALRVPIQRELKQSIVFKVDTLNVSGEWAFLRGMPQRPNGSRVNFRITRYREAQRLGMFDEGVTGLLRKRGGRWRVVTYNIGATDVAWDDWDKRFGVPRRVMFP